MKRVTKWMLIVVGVAAGAGLVVTVCRPAAVPVETAAVARRPLQVTIAEEGETRVRDRYVVAAPVAGRVLRIELREGDSVAPGMVVARLVPPPLDARTREQAEARAAQAEDAERASLAGVALARAAFEQAERTCARAQDLAARGLLAPEERERAELEETARARELESADFRAKAAAHDAAAARAALLAGAGHALALVSPVRARVLRVPERSERVVAAGTPLLELGDPARLEVVVDLLSADAVSVRPGQAMLIEGWGGGTLHGRVRLVEPSGFTKVSALGVEEQRVNVVGDLTDPDAALGDRYRVEVQVVVWQADTVLQLPVSAAFRSGEGWAAFVVEHGRARLRPLALGRRSSQGAEVLDGLAAGEVVIRHPSDRVADGVAVRTAP